MARIDKFIQTGHTKETETAGDAPAVVESTEEGSKGVNEIQALLERNGIAKKGEKMFTSHVVNKDGVDPSKYMPGGGLNKVTETTTVTETHYEVDGVKKDGLIAQNNMKFGPGSTEKTANDFLNMVKDREAAKYKPQKDGKYR